MSDIRLIRVPAVMTRISPTKDGGFALGFHTNEVPDEAERANMLYMFNKFGWLIFADHAVNEIPRELPDHDAGAKTQSERIRSALYRLFEYRYKDKERWDDFYDRMTEAFITKIKEELPPMERS